MKILICAGSLMFIILAISFPPRTLASGYRPQVDTVPALLVNFYVSNNGSNSSDGTSSNTPKRNIGSITSLLQSNPQTGAGTVISLENNSIFREEFVPVNNIRLKNFGREKSGSMPKITGMDIIRQWIPTVSRSNVYENLLTHSIDLTNPRYSYIMVAEIDTILEQKNPLMAVKYLTLVSGVDACEFGAGSYYTQDLTTNPAKVYIHPSAGVPGSNRFRYEVSTRQFNINGYYTDSATYENLILQTAGNGYGMLAGGDNTLAKNIIFQGGGTHHLVIKSGMIDSCLFLKGPQGLSARIAAIFYEAEGKNNVNRLSNSTFIDIPVPIYTHTNGAVNHKSFTIDNVYAFGDSTDASQGLSSADTDTVSVANSYAENYPTGWYGVAHVLSIKNTIFRNTNQAAIHILQPKGAASVIDIDNVLIKTNGNDANQDANNGWVAFGVRAAFPNITVNFTHSIVHGYSIWHQNTESAIQTFQTRGRLNALRNIFICDINDNNYMHISDVDNSGGIGTSSNTISDYNVYLLVRGMGFHWFVNPNNNNESSILALPLWQSLTGQDKHSIFIDLRNNSMGLRAVFTDPANGNWSFTSTDIAERIKAVGAGMVSPPLYYPQRPIVHNSEAFVTPGGFSSFKGEDKSPNESLLQWNTYHERDLSFFNVETGSDSMTFVSVDTLQGMGNGSDHTYSYIHNHPEVSANYYRLKVTRKDQSFYYSPVVTLKRKIREGVYLEVYPNPFENTLTIEHPGRKTAVLSIYDVSGRILKTVIVPEGVVRSRIQLAGMNKGMYILRWVSGTESRSSLILK